MNVSQSRVVSHQHHGIHHRIHQTVTSLTSHLRLQTLPDYYNLYRTSCRINSHHNSEQRGQHSISTSHIKHPASDHSPIQAQPTLSNTTSVATTVVDMVGLTSAAGLVGFLSEPDPTLQSFALNSLNENIDLLWPEVSASIGEM